MPDLLTYIDHGMYSWLNDEIKLDQNDNPKLRLNMVASIEIK